MKLLFVKKLKIQCVVGAFLLFADSCKLYFNMEENSTSWQCVRDESGLVYNNECLPSSDGIEWYHESIFYAYVIKHTGVLLLNEPGLVFCAFARNQATVNNRPVLQSSVLIYKRYQEHLFVK